MKQYVRIKTKLAKHTTYEYYLPEYDVWCIARVLKKLLAKLNMSMQDYYDKYLLSDISEKLCSLPGCTNKTNFINVQCGYQKCCCKEHLYKHIGIKNKMFYKNNPDAVIKMSQTISATYDRPGKREAFSIAMKQSIARPQVKQKLSEKSKAYHAKPAIKRKYSLLMKRRHADGTQDNLAFKSFGHGHYVHPNMLLYYGSTKLINDRPAIWLPSDLEHRILDQIELLKLHYAHDHIKIPYIDGSGRTYTPDFEITFNNGKKLLIECKPANKINNSDVQYKASIAKQFIVANPEYIDYIFITDTESYYNDCLITKISQYL